VPLTTAENCRALGTSPNRPPDSAAAADANRLADGPSVLRFRLRLPRLSGNTFGHNS
jgi:hypothetical protein